MKKKTLKGKPKPLGATVSETGVNFALFSKNATQVTLYLKGENDEQFIPLNPQVNKTGEIWHIFIKELKLPLRYAFKVDGPHDAPYLFHPEILLTDPYATLLDTPLQWGEERHEKPLALLQTKEPFDWQGIANPGLKTKDLVIYEMHVRGFTRDPSSRVKYAGTFLGLIEKIPYLLDLGINAVELMPIQEFNECGYIQKNPKAHKRLYNYWGYATINFFMPMNRYCSGKDDCITEFKMMVRELHRHGIEVILDIVFNHTGESEDSFYSFKGIDRTTYYMLDKGQERNFTGCGNTMNLNHPVMRSFVRDCLYYWVTEMHVDGFRFDLASIMNRDTNGKLLQPSALIEELTFDPLLSDVKLIAEPWDLEGYQLGGFYPEVNRWSEWNGKYRDAVRRFIKGDRASKNEFATRVTGSRDLFSERGPSASINFITVHDGFTLSDLVSYNKKHNASNGEENRDGNSNNESWNCGIEGPTHDVEIFNLRQRQMKNFVFALFISHGVPLLHMGDEYGHTKKGNNNTWCQDNDLSWFTWDKHAPLFHFIQQLIRFRKRHPLLTREDYYKEDEIIWYGPDGKSPPNWDDPTPFLAYTLIDPKGENLFIVFNADCKSITITLPTVTEGKHWHLIVNTNATNPYDFIEDERSCPLPGATYDLERYASILLKLL